MRIVDIKIYFISALMQRTITSSFTRGAGGRDG